MSTELTPSVNCLPPETLAEIFSLARCGPVDLVSPKFPWIISLVCTKWRDIAISTPQLWSSFCLRLFSMAPPIIHAGHDVLLASMTLYLERSKDHPLTIKICATGNEEEDLEYIPSFLELCAQHVRRWEDVHFDVRMTMLEPFICRPDIVFPQLRSFRCHIYEVSSLNQGLTGAEIFRAAPILSKLCFSCFIYQHLSWELPWSQVTDFTATFPLGGPSNVLGVLKFMPNLVFARLNILSGDQALYGNFEPLTFSHLRLLSWCARGVDLGAFFDSIQAPCLTEIQLDSVGKNAVSPLQRFIQRSRCTIIATTLKCIPSPILFSILSILPDIEIVTFSGCELDTHWLASELTYDIAKAQPWLCPKIKQIVLHRIPCPVLLGGVFISMIESRFCAGESDNRGCRLGSVHVVDDDPENPSEISRFIQRHISPQYLRSIICGPPGLDY